MIEEAPPVLRLVGVCAGFDGTPVLDDVCLDVGEGDFVAVVGVSGCGKTTLLRVASGLKRPDRGQVLLEGRPVRPSEPALPLVFQHASETLLPWKSALDNVLFGLRPEALGGRLRARQEALALLDEMGLSDAANRLPFQLSGGMQQRVALARALVRRPRVLLLDEPFSAIDESTRSSLHDLLLELWRGHPCAVVLVSHQLDDVASLARRVVVLAGRPARLRELAAGQPLSRHHLRAELASA
jgi:NitT/TauT family transport system ATP-binding protein